MKNLKLIGAATFSSPPRGVVAAKLGQMVPVRDNDDADALLAMSYMDPNGNEIPYFSENPDAPLLFQRKAVTLSMMEAVKTSTKKAKTGVRKSRARRVPSPAAA